MDESEYDEDEYEDDEQEERIDRFAELIED
jgi:hypothetical protein